MKTSPAGIQFIQSHEGLRLHPYQDEAGIWTIGYGHTQGVNQHTTAITLDQAKDYLKDDLEEAERAVNRYVTAPLNQHQFDALVSFTFNLGPGNLKKSTLLSVLNRGMYYAASHEFQKWHFSGGKPSKGLLARRNSESKLFLTPEKG